MLTFNVVSYTKLPTQMSFLKSCDILPLFSSYFFSHRGEEPAGRARDLHPFRPDRAQKRKVSHHTAIISQRYLNRHHICGQAAKRTKKKRRRAGRRHHRGTGASARGARAASACRLACDRLSLHVSSIPPPMCPYW